MTIAFAVVGGAAIGGYATYEAGKDESNAANNATNFQEQELQQEQANIQPWLTSGGTANTALMQYLGLSPGQPAGVPGGPTGGFNGGALTPISPATIFQDPNYAFTMNQALNATTNVGTTGQGNIPQALQQTAAGVASGFENQDENLQMNRIAQIYQMLSGASTTGANAAVGSGSNTNAATGNIANTITGTGNAQAATLVGGANAITSAGSSLGSNYLLSQALQSLKAGGTGSGGNVSNAFAQGSGGYNAAGQYIGP
jgi:hypothetical protein